MDSLFDDFNEITAKKRTTYKKVVNDEEDNIKTKKIPEVSIPVIGESILFVNSKLDQIRNRLEGKDIRENRPELTQVLSQIQVIANLYAGGEDLEKEDLRPTLTKTHMITEQIEIQTQKISNTQTLQIPQFTQATQAIQITQTNQQIDTTQVTQVNQESNISQNYIRENILTKLLHKTKGESNAMYEEDTGETTTQVIALRPTSISNHEDEITQVFPFTVPDPTQVNAELKISEIERELQEEELELNRKTISKEHLNIKEKIVSRKKFTKEDFLATFDDVSSSEDEKMDSSIIIKDISDIEFSKKEKCKLPEQKKQVPKPTALSNYENELRNTINIKKCIEFSDSDNDNECTQSASHVAKAVILNIKANRSKQKPILKPQENQSALNDLFNNLKKASRQQILNHQREVIENKGYKIEEIEKEKEIIENLLEQEIARNKRIRQREKENETNQYNGEDQGHEYSDFDYSANELDGSDVPESEVELAEGSDNEAGSQNDFMNDKGDEEAGEKKREFIEEITYNSLPKSTDLPNNDDKYMDEDEDEGFKINNRKTHKAKILDESDSDADGRIPKTMSAIDLGHYGDNLGQETNSGKPDSVVYNEDEDNHDTQQDDEAYREMVTRGLQKRKEQDKKKAAMLREMKAKGVNDMFEVEAEESEDEWHGIGGADGEQSDEYDSEVEKMIDDYSKSNFNPDEIREMMAAENKEMDLQMINKILYDIKNGGFRKKRRNGMELELSDDEDDDLKAYRAKRRALMREKRLELDGNKKLVNNPKSSAFFECMVDDIVDNKNPFDEYDGPVKATSDTEPEPESHSTHDIKDIPKKKKIVISEDFVQRSLSFLSSSRHLEEFELNNKLAKEQHSGSINDLHNLKSHSSIKSLRTLTDLRSSSIASKLDTLDADIENTPFEDLRQTSVLKSFGSNNDINSKFKEGNKTVKVSKSYRAVGSARASITFMSKSRKLIAPKKKSNLSVIGKPIPKTNNNTLFNSAEDSFEQ